MQQPLAVAIIGGLLVQMPLVLLVIPMLVSLLDRIFSRRKAPRKAAMMNRRRPGFDALGLFASKAAAGADQRGKRCNPQRKKPGRNTTGPQVGAVP